MQLQPSPDHREKTNADAAGHTLLQKAWKRDRGPGLSLYTAMQHKGREGVVEAPGGGGAGQD